MAAVRFHVFPCGGQWQLDGDGGRIAIFETQIAAMDAACDRAEQERPLTILVDGAAGDDAVGDLNSNQDHQPADI